MDKPRAFLFRITLGELVSALAIIGGIITFTLKYEGRLVALESTGVSHERRLDRIEGLLEAGAHSYETVIRNQQVIIHSLDNLQQQPRKP